MGGTVPQFGGGVELGGRVWHLAKVLRIRSNLFPGTETLTLSVSEPIAKKVWLVLDPIWGRGRARRSGVAPRKSPPY